MGERSEAVGMWDGFATRREMGRGGYLRGFARANDDSVHSRFVASVTLDGLRTRPTLAVPLLSALGRKCELASFISNPKTSRMAFKPFDRMAQREEYRRHLPHWTQPGCTYFLTFRLASR